MSAPASPALITTVLVPVARDGVQLLADTLASLLGQTRPPDEIVLLALDSDVGLWDQLRALQERHRAIVLVQQKAPSLARALNAGAAVATGELISWLRPGCRLMPAALEALAEGLRAREDAGLAFGRCPHVPQEASRERAATPTTAADLLDDDPVGCAFLLRKAALATIGPLTEEFPGAEAWDCWIRLAERSALAALPEVLCACGEQCRRLRAPDVAVSRALTAHHRRRWVLAQEPASPESMMVPDAVATGVPRSARSMRVLLVTRELAPAGGYGVGWHVRGLARALRAQGCEVHVLANAADGRGAMTSEGACVHSPLHRPPFSAPTHVSDLLQQQGTMLEEALDLYARHGSFDVLHVHGWDCASLAHAIQEVRGTPLTITIHRLEALEISDEASPEDLYAGGMQSWMGEAADVVICHSHFAAQQARRVYGIPAEKIEVLPLGISNEDWRSDADLDAFRELFGPAGCRLITFAGRVQHSTGPQVLVESLPHVLAVAPQARVVIAGDGPLAPALRQRAQQLGLEAAVTFTGYLSGKVLATLLRASSVHVVPSLVEASGAGAAEAMACGVPVVAAASGGLPELIEQESNGLLVPAGDARALAEAIVRVIYNTQLAHRLADGGRRRAADSHAISGIVASLSSLYSRLRA